MSILKYKYKAHKLVNTLFYVAVFGIGFILGFSTNKIDFNKLVSQFLMIDSAKAYTISTYGGNTVNEDFIYERFLEVKSDFSFYEFPYITCFIYSSGAFSSNNALVCTAITESSLTTDKVIFFNSGSANYNELKGLTSGIDVIGFRYYLGTNAFIQTTPSTYNYSDYLTFYTNYEKSRTGNNNRTEISNTYFKNVLDFSLYDSIYDYNGIIIDEDYIYERFMENNNNDNTTDFDITTFPYIYCSIYDVSATDSSDPRLACNAVKEEMLNPSNLLFYKHSSTSNYYAATSGAIRDSATAENPNVVGFQYRIVSKTFTSKYPTSVMYTNNAHFYTNFSKSNVGYGSHIELPDDRFHNVLDFSRFDKLQFNENLFKDNPDFKEVCVPNNKKFAISTNNYELNENESSEYYGTKSFSSYEFLWFPYKIEGLSTYLYDNSKTDNVWVLEDDETYFEMNPGYWYWLNSKEEIDLYFNKEDPGNFLSSLGYENKYSYYGWYFHPFIVRYANSGLRQFNIFYFNDAAEVTKLDGSVSDNYEEYCFYIKNDFNVNILNTDEFGDQFGDITIMEDENLEVSTSQNVSSIDSKGLFAKVRLFLNKMSGTIDFVGDYIYELYESMPVILKLFIFSVFGLIVIKIIIGMVVK